VECRQREWHGATPATAVTRLAIREAMNGSTDEQYRK